MMHLQLVLQIIIFTMSLYSTVKLSHYSVDGSGRDSYINVNNGGIFRKFKDHNLDFFESGSFKIKHVPRKIAPEITARVVWYRNDGTGRDTYAVQEKRAPRRRNYLESLRSYEYNPENQCSFSRSLSKQQQASVKRLSYSKRYEDPYENLRKSFRVSVDRSWRKSVK